MPSTVPPSYTAIFVPWDIPGTSGATPPVSVHATAVNPHDYNPAELVYSMDLSKFWNTAGAFFLFGAYSSGVADAIVTPESAVDPLNYDPALQIYSMDASKFWNAANIFIFGAY